MWGLCLGHRLSSGGMKAPVIAAHGLSCCSACGIPVLQPGIEPTSPTSQGGFLTTGPPEKSLTFKKKMLYFKFCGFFFFSFKKE